LTNTPGFLAQARNVGRAQATKDVYEGLEEISRIPAHFFLYVDFIKNSNNLNLLSSSVSTLMKHISEITIIWGYNSTGKKLFERLKLNLT